MTRLPQPGGDSGDWGTILNDFLSQAHNSDGTLKDDSVTSMQIAPNAVTATQLAPNAVTSASLPDATAASTGIIQLAGDLSGTATVPTVPALTTKLDVSALDTDSTLAADSDSMIPTQKAVKTYIDTGLATKADASAVGAQVLLIDNAASLPAGTPAGVIVVVKS